VVAESRPESGLLMPNPGIIPLWSPMCWGCLLHFPGPALDLSGLTGADQK
jgi:hypothetical protein